jgi:hypothetical protein
MGFKFEIKEDIVLIAEQSFRLFFWDVTTCHPIQESWHELTKIRTREGYSVWNLRSNNDKKQKS